MIKRISQATFLRCRTASRCSFSSLKTKLQPIQTKDFSNLSQLYDQMVTLEQSMTQLQKLKYSKHLQSFDNKINNLMKKELEHQESAKSAALLQLLNREFNTSASFTYLYSRDTQKCAPFTKSLNVTKIPLPELTGIVVQAGQKQSRFLSDLSLAHRLILSSPTANPELYASVQQKCEYLEEHLSLNVFEDYSTLLMESCEESAARSRRNKALKELKKQSTPITKNVSFLVNSNLSQADNYYASEIAKILTKYGFASNKSMMFSMKSLTAENLDKLTPAALKNHLFVLAYHMGTVKEVNDNIFKIYDVMLKCSQQGHGAREFLGEMGPLNSLAFYMLANKVEVYEIFKQMAEKIESDFEQRANNQAPAQSIDAVDSQIFVLMLQIFRAKYDIQIKHWAEIKKYLTCSREQICSDAHVQFQRYLSKRAYKFDTFSNKSEISLGLPFRVVSRDRVVKIDDKYFLCLDLPRINKQSSRANGVAELILDYYKSIDQPVKIINPLVVTNCEKLTHCEEYFRSKLKNITEPPVVRKRWYQ